MAEWDVPGYTGLKMLGSGGFGDVVLARHDASGTLVAIKYLRPNLLADAQFTRLFRAEAEVLAQVDDPHVVRLYEYVESPSGAAIVMELIDGVSLREILFNQGATTAEAALVVLQGSLLGLAATHQHGVVHRDYKPENVLVNANGDSKLTDFGIAARAGDSPIPAGTMIYAPPEQFSGSPATPAGDVYAAAATFYECLVGRPPFTGDTAERLLYQHLSQPVPLDPVPAPLRPLVAAGMAKDPRDRPADGTTFVSALNSIAAGAYGPDWADRGRSHLGEAALLLAALWPSASVPGVQGSAVQQVNLSQDSHGASESGHAGQARHASAEARHRWHLRHLAHLRHREHLEHLESVRNRDRRFKPVKTAVGATAALALAGAGTALIVSATTSFHPAAAVHGVALQQVQLHPSLAGEGSSPAPGSSGPGSSGTGSSAPGSSGAGSSSASSGSGSAPGSPGVSSKKHSSPHEGSSSSPASGSSSSSGSPGSGSSSSSPPKTVQPQISGISPASGPAAGGTKVTITGTGLGHATGVSFGGAAGAITADSASQIIVSSPAGSGTVGVTVTTAGGTSAAARFTYAAAPPTVTGLSPASGPAAGGTAVTISGTGLGHATGVRFGGAAGAITADSASQIIVTSPAGSGTVDVTVTTEAGAAGAGRFTYEAPPPVIASISPSSGPASGGTAVTISGTGLSQATGVSFGGAAGAITADSASQIIVTSPAGTGTVDVTVTTAGGTGAAGRFTYEVPPPVIDAISPSSGSTTGGTTVTISGSGLAGATAVSFGGAGAKIVADSGTQITVVSPAGSGTVNITVTTAGGTSAITAADRFTYVEPIE